MPESILRSPGRGAIARDEPEAIETFAARLFRQMAEVVLEWIRDERALRVYPGSPLMRQEAVRHHGLQQTVHIMIMGMSNVDRKIPGEALGVQKRGSQSSNV